MPARIVAALCLIFASRAAYGDGGLLSDGHLDTAAVRDAYLRSDIPLVRQELEGFVKNHPKDVAASEKVFTHLYLGASYAGDAATHAKAEAHFRAALKLDPAADPANLYLPPTTKAWFESLRAEARQASATPPESAEPAPAASPAPVPPPAPPAERAAPPPNQESAPEDTFTAVARRRPAPAPAPEPSLAAAPAHRAWLWWTVGSAAAAAAAGVGAFAYVQSHSDPGTRHVQVDATLK